jgi:ubiquitin-protein ligase
MSIRLKRLKSDYDKICTMFTGKSRIRILKTLGDPPERYQIEYLVPGLQASLHTGAIRTHNSFIAEITLTAAYPRMAPQCKMLTPVFHPNIAPHAICIGDHWAAGESLPHLIVRIAEMLTFQSYNVKSPLNGEAARWVEQNQSKLPLDTFDFASLLSVGEAVGRNPDGTLKAGAVCANCGKESSAEPMQVCVNQHVTCRSCMLSCPTCGAVLCLSCSLEKCALCGRSCCFRCMVKCRACGRYACKEHAVSCALCRHAHCRDCAVNCYRCGRTVCVEHVKKVIVAGEKKYACPTCAVPPRRESGNG